MADLKKLAMGRKGIQKAAGDDAKKKQKAEKHLEQTSAEEIGEIEEAFRGRMAKEDKRRKNATDSETWFCVYFNTRQEKEAFLRKHNLLVIGDKYLAGRAVDRALQRPTPARDGHRRER